MAENRLIGAYPVIGIRPIIDGRRGALKVRESLEDQTMNMAESAAKLFEDNLRYADGTPVKVVIADTAIPADVEEKIFRPASWNAFGQDREGADYRACATYGPCFKK